MGEKLDKKIYDTVYKIEDTYWWFVGQRFLVNQFLLKYYNSNKNLTILDAGCGTGINAKMLSKFGKVYGIDISDDALQFCRIRGIINVKKSNVMNIKFKNNMFDVVAALGIFYHKCVIDDVKGMKEIYRVLKPGGRLFIVDSAMKCLHGKHDLVFHSGRRYSKNELGYKLQKAGFKVEKISYYNTLFFPAIYVYRKLSNLLKSPPKSDINESINPLLNFLLNIISKIEILGIKYTNYPFGVNIFVVAKKPH